MPRLARVVLSDIPFHITQRGNRREDVFFCDLDREFYLDLLHDYCVKHEVEVWAYCLMTNHVHLILKPSTEDGLQKVLKPLHMRYAQYINKKHDWKGHLWQGRFFSSALDEAYTHSAVRYVEQNPVRAKIVDNPEDYLWSSAAAHMGITESVLLSNISESYSPAGQRDWKSYLQKENLEEHMIVLRRNIDKGLPCGGDGFIEGLEKKTNRNLKFKPIGRPVKG